MVDSRKTAYDAINRIYVKVTKNISSFDAVATQSAVEMLSSYFDKFQRQHDLLMAKAADDAEREGHEDLFISAEELYCDAKNILRRNLIAIEPSTSGGSGGVGESKNVVSGICTHAHSKDVRLPPLQIVKFDGQESNWLEFRDMFEAMVHNKSDVDEAVKLARLREVVDSTKVTQVAGVYTGGYEEVWKEIKERYERPKRLVQAHTNILLSLEDDPVESGAVIRRVIDHFRKFVRSMAVLKLPADKWDAILFPLIFKKMPREAVAHYNRKCSDDDAIPEVKKILREMEQYADTVQTVEPRTLQRPRQPEADRRQDLRSVQRPRQQNARSHVAAVAPQTVGESCLLCTRGHALANCKTFLDLDVMKRKEFIASRRLCFRCLGSGHRCLNCNVPPCSRCNGSHHSLLCLGHASPPDQRVAVQPQNVTRA